MTFFYEVAPLAARMGMTEHAACITLGISGSTEQQYRGAGMSREVAERRALKAGFHPYEVWPSMLDDDIADQEQVCAAPDCPVRFVPPPTGLGQKRRHYCCRTCQQRTNARRSYQTNEATRRRRQEASRRYKHEIAELRSRRLNRSA